MIDFLHITIDLSLRAITAPDGTPITICQVESNVPIVLWQEEQDEIYSLGKALKPNDGLYFDIKPFVLIVKRCADTMCLFVIAPNDIEESIYHVKRIEQGKVINDDTPHAVIGKVSKGSRYEFDLMVGSPEQAFRIETIPAIDCVLGKSKIVHPQEGNS